MHEAFRTTLNSLKINYSIELNRNRHIIRIVVTIGRANTFTINAYINYLSTGFSFLLYRILFFFVFIWNYYLPALFSLRASVSTFWWRGNVTSKFNYVRMIVIIKMQKKNRKLSIRWVFITLILSSTVPLWVID